MYSNQDIPVFFVTADLAVYAATIGAAGKSGGDGYPVSTQWMIDPESIRPATAEECEEHSGLIEELIGWVEPRVKFDGGRPYIAADVLLHARIGYPVTGRTQWGRSNFEFWDVLRREKNAA